MNPSRPLAALVAAVALAGAALLSACPASKPDCRPPGLRCGGQCVDGNWDASNCGACGHACGAGTACCLGACVDVHGSDAQNCGACGSACALNGVCTAGACGCPGPLPDLCTYPLAACVDLATGAGGSCGSCGWSCAGAGVQPADAPCQAGVCACAGGPTATDCTDGAAGRCKNLQVDGANCGACGNACPARSTCEAGSCACGSASWPDWCGSTAGCVSLASDPANCGSCGHACAAAAPACSGGTCCPSGQTTCAGVCVDTLSSPTNCGSCGHACGAGLSCCAGACVDTRSTATSCGACGHACASGGTCSASTCACPAGQPTSCGPVPGTCCAGTACCAGGACQTAHDNGLGQAYHDCAALDAHTKAQAFLAADAWSPGGASADQYLFLCGGPDCLCREKGADAAVWCYGTSTLAGRVILTGNASCAGTAACPFGSAAAWR